MKKYRVKKECLDRNTTDIFYNYHYIDLFRLESKANNRLSFGFKNTLNAQFQRMVKLIYTICTNFVLSFYLN